MSSTDAQYWANAVQVGTAIIGVTSTGAFVVRSADTATLELRQTSVTGAPLTMKED